MSIFIRKYKSVKAKKRHTCHFCCKKIQVGEKYLHTLFVDSSIYALYNWHTCGRCLPYINEAFDNKAYDWSDGMSSEDFKSYMWKEHRDIAIEWEQKDNIKIGGSK